MDKKKISLESPKMETTTFGEQVIKVKPYISSEEQIELIGYYIEQYFQSSTLLPTEKDYLMAEYTLMTGVIDKCTDIMIFDEDGKPVLTINDFISHQSLWDDIRSKIVNYFDFHMMLDRIVNDIKEDMLAKKSLGYVIDNLVDKIMESLEKFSTLDSTEMKQLVSEINDSPILKSISEKLDIPKEVSKPKKSKKEKIH